MWPVSRKLFCFGSRNNLIYQGAETDVYLRSPYSSIAWPSEVTKMTKSRGSRMSYKLGKNSLLLIEQLSSRQTGGRQTDSWLKGAEFYEPRAGEVGAAFNLESLDDRIFERLLLLGRPLLPLPLPLLGRDGGQNSGGLFTAHDGDSRVRPHVQKSWTGIEREKYFGSKLLHKCLEGEQVAEFNRRKVFLEAGHRFWTCIWVKKCTNRVNFPLFNATENNLPLTVIWLVTST